MNIGYLLTKSAKHYADKPAIIFQDKEYTFREFNTRVNSLASALIGLGIEKQSRIVILQSNCSQFLESLFACFKAGMVAVPLNYRLHPKEIEYIVNDCQSVTFIFGDNFTDIISVMRHNTPNVKHYICLAGSHADWMYGYEYLIETHNSNEVCCDVMPKEIAWLFYTSGTTGKPKGAMLSHRNLYAMTMNFLADLAQLTHEDTILHAAPLSHGSGLYSIPNIARGATNVILPAFKPTLVSQAIEERKVTNMFVAPTMIKALLNSKDFFRFDLRSLQYVIYGGAPMYVEDLKEAIKKFGPVFIQVYGQGEAPMTITYMSKAQHTSAIKENNLQEMMSAGFERTDIEVKIVDAEDNQVSIDEIGEIVCRGDVVMEGYWQKPEETIETLKGGWLHTGDLGKMDKNGFVYILDRSKDMIISGGQNIYPREVEEVIMMHPAVQEVTVIGVPDNYWGESVKAIVVLKHDSTASELEIIDFCKMHLSSFKKPTTVEFRESLPKNSYGKILKRELKEMYWLGRDRKV